MQKSVLWMAKYVFVILSEAKKLVPGVYSVGIRAGIQVRSLDDGRFFASAE